MGRQVEKRIGEFVQNATLSDAQLIAYAYRPIPASAYVPPEANRGLEKSKVIYIELPRDAPMINLVENIVESPENAVRNQDESVTRENPAENSVVAASAPVNPRLQSLKKPRAYSSIDAEDGSVTTEEAFFNEVVKGQTFLGLASFAFQPKPVSLFCLPMSLDRENNAYVYALNRMFWMSLKI